MAWEDVHKELERLTHLRPSPLISHPALDTGEDLPLPVQVGLAPWALDFAVDLAGAFGEDLELTVGFLRYPARQRFTYPGSGLQPPQHYPTIDPEELTVELHTPLAVASGHELLATVVIGNRTATPVVLVTNGHLSGRVVDEHGEGIGGSVLVEPSKRVDVHIGHSESHPVSLSVGTASLEPELGYSIPPGRWGVDFLLHLTDGRIMRSPALALTVT